MPSLTKFKLPINWTCHLPSIKPHMQAHTEVKYTYLFFQHKGPHQQGQGKIPIKPQN